MNRNGGDLERSGHAPSPLINYFYVVGPRDGTHFDDNFGLCNEKMIRKNNFRGNLKHCGAKNVKLFSVMQ